MPYTLDTLIPNAVLYQTVSGNYSVQEMSEAAIGIVKFLDTYQDDTGFILTKLSNSKFCKSLREGA